MYNLYPPEYTEEGPRQYLSEDQYRVHISPENVTITIPCDLIEGLFSEGNNHKNHPQAQF